MFTCKIKTGGAAYRDENGDGYDRYNHELIRNLKEIITKMERGDGNGYIMDINGNKVGTWNIEE